MTLKQLIPMLNVSNIEASLKFYEEALDFRIVSDPAAVRDWRWATIRSGDTELMLAETDCDLGLAKIVDPHAETCWPTIFYFYPDDVAMLHERVLQRGFQPSSLLVTFYGMREFSLRDPDGHLLSFGQEAEAR